MCIHTAFLQGYSPNHAFLAFESLHYSERIKQHSLNLFSPSYQVSIDATTEFFTAYLEVLMYARADEVSQYGKPTDKSRCVCLCVHACVTML